MGIGILSHGIVLSRSACNFFNIDWVMWVIRVSPLNAWFNPAVVAGGVTGGMFIVSGLVGGGVSLIPLVLVFFGVGLGISLVTLGSASLAMLEVVAPARLNLVTLAISYLIDLARSDMVQGLDSVSVMSEVWISRF